MERGRSIIFFFFFFQSVTLQCCHTKEDKIKNDQLKQVNQTT
jgi:hypothetical protein